MDGIKVGDFLKDNDPRSSHRAPMQVVEILPNGVVAEESNGRQRAYLAKRIHTDGKPRRSGLTLIKDSFP